MKKGEVYIHKKGHIFKVVKVYDGPTVIMKELWSGDEAIDKIEIWEEEKMKKLN